jgi:hypothetical protein
MRSERCEAVLIILLLLSLMTPVTASVDFSSSAPGIITKGDTFSVSGTSAVNGTVRIWIIGRDHFEGLTTAPDRHGNFSIVFKPSATKKFSSGRYAVIFEDPGRGGLLEIEPGTDSNGNPAIMNRGKIIAKLGPREDLGGDLLSIVQVLLLTSSIHGVDDSFIPAFFFVEEPAVHVDHIIPASGSRLPDMTTGESLFFSGTTNVGIANSLRAEIHNVDSNELPIEKTIPVLAGREINTWSYEIKSPGLPPGNYNLKVCWTESIANGSGIFTVRNPLPPTPLPVNPPVEKLPIKDDLTFPLLVGSTLLVIAIVLYATGRK